MKLVLSLFLVTIVLSFNSPQLLALQVNDKFSSYYFKVTGSCKNLKTLNFNSLKNTIDITAFGVDDQGRELSVSAELQLKENGTYWLEYRERVLLEVIDEQIYVYSTYFKKRLVDSWIEVDGTITLNNLGIVEPYDDIDSTFLILKMDNNINDERILGKNIYLNRVSSSFGPNGQSKQEYCRIR